MYNPFTSKQSICSFRYSRYKHIRMCFDIAEEEDDGETKVKIFGWRYYDEKADDLLVQYVIRVLRNI